jgi:hypothetical protein
MKKNNQSARAAGGKFWPRPINCVLVMLMILPGQMAWAQVIRGTSFDQPPATNAIVTAPAMPPKVVDGYLQVGFERLSAFPVVMPTADTNGVASKPAIPLPAEIMALNGKKIFLQGFMLPLKQDDSRVTEFFFLKNQNLCCFGKCPKPNEWMHVTMPVGKGIPFGRIDCVVTVWGTLHVGAIHSHSQMAGIYSLDGDKMSF